MKYLLILLSISLFAISCNKEETYGEGRRQLTILPLQNIDTLDYKTGDTIKISCMMSSLNSELDRFELLADFDVENDGWFAPSGCVPEVKKYYNDNGKFDNGLNSIIVNYKLIVRSGLFAYQFKTVNKLGEELISDSLYVQAKPYSTVSTKDYLQYDWNFLYSVSTNEVLGHWTMNGADYLNKLTSIDFVASYNSSNYNFMILSPHSSVKVDRLRYTHPFYNDDSSCKCTNKTLFLVADDKDFDNLTQEDFDELNFDNAQYSIEITPTSIVAFKTQKGDIGFLKPTYVHWSKIKFTIKVL